MNACIILNMHLYVHVQFVPESARYYVVRGKNLKAKKALSRVALYNCKQPVEVMFPDQLNVYDKLFREE